ncbi:MAG: DNA polymerase III subunit delta [bacterium]
MRIGADDLAAALRRPLGPLYTVVANEPLLGHEALAALRARALAEGYDERTVLTSESGFRWEALRAAGDSLSLFASRRLVEVRVPTGKPGREGGQALADYAKRLPPDTVTLVSLPALDWSGMKAAWLKALEAAGVLVMADPFPRDRLVDWIEARLAKNGQRAAHDTLAFLADRVEGNLSAANQEVEKLALSFEPGELSFEQVSGSVLDVSRFDLRALGAAMLDGDRTQLVRMIDGLRAEGSPLPLVTWTLAHELRALVGVHDALDAGRQKAAALREAGVFGPRSDSIGRAASRIDARRARRALRAVGEIERASKGLGTRDPWQLITALCLGLSGMPKRPAPRSG